MANITVGTTAVELPLGAGARPLIQNLGAGNLYLGRRSTVTSSTGIKLVPGATYEFPADLGLSGGSVWLIADAAGTDVRYDTVG